MEVEEFDIYAQKDMKQLENVVDKRSILEDFFNSSGQNSFFFLPKTETEFISTESLSVNNFRTELLVLEMLLASSKVKFGPSRRSN